MNSRFLYHLNVYLDSMVIRQLRVRLRKCYLVIRPPNKCANNFGAVKRKQIWQHCKSEWAGACAVQMGKIAGVRFAFKKERACFVAFWFRSRRSRTSRIVLSKTALTIILDTILLPTTTHYRCDCK